jgi:hypothetical protein
METDSYLSRLSLVMGQLRPGDRASGSPYVTFLAKRLPAGLVPRRVTTTITEKKILPDSSCSLDNKSCR